MNDIDQCDSRLSPPAPAGPLAGGRRPGARGSQDALEVLRPGLLTTVQDRGRRGYQKFGVPTSGAVDQVALRVGNILVGNSQDAAALEITASGPRLRVLSDVVLALTGAEVQAELDGEPLPAYQSFLARTGQVLDTGTCRQGLRAYLAVAGGIDVPVVLGSRSTCLVANFGGYRGRAVCAGDILGAGPARGPLGVLADRAAPEEWRLRPVSPTPVRVVLGPQDEAFTEEGLRTFLESVYQVTPHVDRMGCRLEGPPIAHRDSADIISDWIPMGSIQVPGDGKPILLLADRQTTGGYAKIATVIGPDLGLVAQARPGDWLRFRAVSAAEAQALARTLDAALNGLPANLIPIHNWGEVARLGEVPGRIPLSHRDPAAQAIQAPEPGPER